MTATTNRRRVAALGLALAALLPVSAGPTTAAEVPNGTLGKIAGMGVSPAVSPQQQVVAEFPRIRRLGINTAMIDVFWEADGQDASAIHPGPRTTSDADLRLAIRRAREAGFRVLLHPKFQCSSCEGGARWRGRIQPRDRATFYTSYRTFIEHYASMADSTGVSMFFLGSELNSLQRDTEQWREIARTARAVYSGQLVYEANWDALNAVQFWDSVDVIGVAAYFPLSDERLPDVATLKAAWKASRATIINNGRSVEGRRWFDELKALARRTDRQILFGEVGYQSSTYAAMAPFSESQTQEYSAQLQADAYQAVLETFENEDWWAGAVWWEWVLSAGGDRDLDYTPRGKLAETLLGRWYAQGRRPDAPGESLTSPPPGSAGGGTSGGSAGGPAGGGTDGSVGGGATRPASPGATVAGRSVAPAPGGDLTAPAQPGEPGGGPQAEGTRLPQEGNGGGMTLILIVVGALAATGATGYFLTRGR